MSVRDTAALALWLAEHVHLIARSERAGDCFREVDAAVDAIGRMINRPFPPRILGPCTHWVADRKQCGTRLVADRKANEVTCPKCRTTHNVDKLIKEQTADIEDKSFTITELWKIILPVQGMHVPLRTLQWWSARGKLMPTGYDGDHPRFMLREVRELWEARKHQGKTGATAHKRRAS